MTPTILWKSSRPAQHALLTNTFTIRNMRPLFRWGASKVCYYNVIRGSFNALVRARRLLGVGGASSNFSRGDRSDRRYPERSCRDLERRRRGSGV